MNTNETNPVADASSNRNNGGIQNNTAPQPASDPQPTTRPEPKVIEIPEDAEFFVEGQKVSIPRINGVRSARISGLSQKIVETGNKTFKRVVLKVQLDQKQPDGEPYTTEYECPMTWKPASELQSVAATILGRPLTPEEVRASKFNINQLRGKPCNVYVTEYRSTKSKNRTLVVGSFQPKDALVASEVVAA